MNPRGTPMSSAAASSGADMLPGWPATIVVLPDSKMREGAPQISPSPCPVLSSSGTSPVRLPIAAKWCDHFPTSTPQLMSDSRSVRLLPVMRSWRCATAPATASPWGSRLRRSAPRHRPIGYQPAPANPAAWQKRPSGQPHGAKPGPSATSVGQSSFPCVR